jgi:hypothetical protein
MANEMVQLNILQPCHEDWQQMTPAEKGRFCGQCKKTVVDFTSMPDEDLLAYFKQETGKTCGRFFEQQLGRPIQPNPLQRSWLRIKWFWATLISGALFANRAAAQNATYGDTVVVTAPKSRTVVTMGFVSKAVSAPILVLGQVTDETGLPMAGVTVMIEGTTVGTTTNAVGMYELRVKEPGKKVQLQFSSIGYMPVQQQIKIAPFGADFVYQQNVQFTKVDVVIAGEVVVVRKKKTKPVKTVKPTIAQSAAEEALHVFPNPAKAGQAIYVTQLPAGKYTLKFYSHDGRPLATACLMHTKGTTHLSWTLPPALSAGIYTLVLTTDNQLSKSVQLLVQ